MSDVLLTKDLNKKLPNGDVGREIAKSANVWCNLAWFFHLMPIVNLATASRYVHLVNKLHHSAHLSLDKAPAF